MTPQREAEIWRMVQGRSGRFLCVRLDRLADERRIGWGEACDLKAKICELLGGENTLERWIAENFDAPEICAYLRGDTHIVDGATKDWIYKEMYEARRRWLDHLIADAERRAEQETKA